MFDIGFSELVLIALLALIVLGPKRLPEVARTAGRWTAKIRRFIADVKQDFDRELHQADLSELRKLKEELDDTRRLMQETSGKLVGDLAAIGSDAAAGVTGPEGGVAREQAPSIAPPPATVSEVATPRSKKAVAAAAPSKPKSVKKARSKKKHGATGKIRTKRGS
jgi:sec-independent protein translocase protein TatB